AGLVGFVICMAAMGGLLWASIILMFSRESRVVSALGTTSMCAVVGRMTAGIAGASFFPTPSKVVILVTGGTVVRVYYERKAALNAGRLPSADRLMRRMGPVSVSGA